MNQTLNAQQQQAPQKVAMPLRIALLVLPSTRLSCDVQSANPLEVLLPELYQSGLLSSKEGASEQIVNIEVDDFEANLKASIQAIDEGKLVQLSTPSQSLLMMPALKAAQLRIHPHAQLAAIQQGDTGVQQTMALALAQAKRDIATVSKVENLHDLDSLQKFAAVHQLITELASRTSIRNEVNRGVTLGPKQAKSHYWFTPNHQARVTAVNFSHSVNNISAGKQINASFIITQGTGFIAPKSIVDSQRLQFVLSGDTQAELLTALSSLKTELLAEPNSDSVLTVMRDNLIAFEQTNTRYAVTLQASSVDAMLLEISAMIEALPAVMAEDGQHSYKTPAGSYFTSEPLGNVATAGLAFVYPGVGTVYADMFSELHRYFPSLYSRLEREGDLKSMLQADAIYHLDAKVAQAMPLGDLAIAGVGSSYLLTQLLMQEFNITPNFALGYSMGEASMWASLGVWENPHDLISKTQTDPLFTTAISGQLSAVRQAWKLDHTDSEIVWNSFVVRSPSEPIKTLLPEFPRAYLAIIQGDTCVIAGCETQCRELLTKLKKRGIAANRVTAMHTTPAMEEHSNVIEFYTQPLRDEYPQDIKFISAASLSGDRRDKAVNEAGVIDSTMIAKSIADTFCHTLDFTSLIHSAQRQGAKLFVELGADRQNSTLIDKIAKLDRSCGAEASSYPCCTVPVNAKGGDDITSLLKALGQLISHRVPLSLRPLIDGLNREIALRELNSAGLTNQNGIISGEPDANKLLKGEV